MDQASVIKYDDLVAAGSEKAAKGSQLILDLFDAWLAPLGFTLMTPRSADQRGGHITVGHPDAKKIAAGMRKFANVVPDYRTPDSIRLAIVSALFTGLPVT